MKRKLCEDLGAQVLMYGRCLSDSKKYGLKYAKDNGMEYINGFVAMFASNQLLELMAQIMGAFQERFNKAPPQEATLLDWKRRAFAFGSVKDKPRTGRKKTQEETCAGVTASIEQSPIKFDT
ncbi:hypothetical protein C0J52_08936 [Blattella germanica]|nr:hypothetical protein C0J52_08936 [Blattella germanica]